MQVVNMSENIPYHRAKCGFSAVVIYDMIELDISYGRMQPEITVCSDAKKTKPLQPRVGVVNPVIFLYLPQQYNGPLRSSERY